MLISSCVQQPVIYITATPPAMTQPLGLPTETIDWFPTTPTLTVTMPPAPEPTLNQKPGIGEVFYQDNFSDRSLWSVVTTQGGSIGYGVNELTIALSSANVKLITAPKEPVKIDNFYLEITMNPSLCKEKDTYGLLFRMQSNGDFYRLVLSCAGKIRLERVTQSQASILQDWVVSGEVLPGAPLMVRMAVWVAGNEIRVFANDKFQFGVTDSALSSGGVALYAFSGGPNALTVNFKDLKIYRIQRVPNQTKTPVPVPTSSQSPAPTRLPAPTGTLRPGQTTTPFSTATVTRIPGLTLTPMASPTH